jgi:hypothetical protein
LENLKKSDHMESVSVDGRIILEWILENEGGEGVDWAHLAQDRDQWWHLVNMLMRLRVP